MTTLKPQILHLLCWRLAHFTLEFALLQFTTENVKFSLQSDLIAKIIFSAGYKTLKLLLDYVDYP